MSQTRAIVFDLKWEMILSRTFFGLMVLGLVAVVAGTFTGVVLLCLHWIYLTYAFGFLFVLFFAYIIGMLSE